MEHDCERNFDGRFFEELGWGMVQQITSDEDQDCFGKFSNQFDSEGSPIFLPKLGSVFLRKQKAFVLKTVFSHTWLRQV